MNLSNVPIGGGDKAKAIALGLTGVLVNEFTSREREGGLGGFEKDTEIGRGHYSQMLGKGVRKRFGWVVPMYQEEWQNQTVVHSRYNRSVVSGVSVKGS